MRVCITTECSNLAIARGLCSKHYSRAIRAGELEDVGLPRYESPHGTIARYTNRKCRCMECRWAARVYGFCWQHNLSLEEAEAILNTEPCKCPICERGGRMVYDHCHISGEGRGWLCDSCNVALGRVDDNPATLEKLAAYLREHNIEDRLSNE